MEKTMDKMSKEELAKEMLKTKQEHQLKMMQELVDKVEHLGEKAIKTSYIPSVEEKLLFDKLVHLINGIAKWF